MSCHISKLLIPETIPVYQSRIRGFPTRVPRRCRSPPWVSRSALYLGEKQHSARPRRRSATSLTSSRVSSAPSTFPSSTSPRRSKGIFTQRIRRSLGLAVHRGWAKLLLDRCRDLVEDPRQPRTHTHETDEDDAEAHEYFHLHQTRGRGGHYRTRQD